ncbi:MAG: nitroreductase family deazaflavin-dependent oxidoreductase [Deltaproteobacteria bacterium]|nr:nitroreductase family deazaflavin-dependent oxidoreductase [Deltaproteobacteria bacterium]
MTGETQTEELASEGGWAESFQRQAFRALNAVVRPSIQRGLGSPCLTPWGMVVLEHTGRQTGRQYKSPLLAVRVGRQVVVTTVRSERSNWIRNLEHQPSTHLWMNGERRRVRAHVMNASLGRDPEEMSDRMARPLFTALRAMVTAGFSVSVLDPA